MLVELYRQGKRISHIANLAQIPRTTVSYIIKNINKLRVQKREEIGKDFGKTC